MQNVVPAGALTRRSRTLLYFAVVVLAFGAVGVASGLFLHAVNFVVRANPAFPTYDLLRKGLIVVGALLLLVALGMTVRALTWKRDNPHAAALGDVFAAFLDQRYIYLRNVSRPKIGYIDAVLVGPAGVLVCRVCSNTGTFYNEGKGWMRRVGDSDWRTLRWSPTQEALDDMQRLEAFLQAKGVEVVPMFGVVVFTEPHPKAIVTTTNPALPVAQFEDLETKLTLNYLAKRDRLPQATVNAIAEWLFA